MREIKQTASQAIFLLIFFLCLLVVHLELLLQLLLLLFAHLLHVHLLLLLLLLVGGIDSLLRHLLERLQRHQRRLLSRLELLDLERMLHLKLLSDKLLIDGVLQLLILLLNLLLLLLLLLLDRLQECLMSLDDGGHCARLAMRWRTSDFLSLSLLKIIKI